MAEPLGDGLGEIRLVDDVVAIEHRALFPPAQPHDFALGDPARHSGVDRGRGGLTVRCAPCRTEAPAGGGDGARHANRDAGLETGAPGSYLCPVLLPVVLLAGVSCGNLPLEAPLSALPLD